MTVLWYLPILKHVCFGVHNDLKQCFCAVSPQSHSAEPLLQRYDGALHFKIVVLAFRKVWIKVLVIVRGE